MELTRRVYRRLRLICGNIAKTLNPASFRRRVSGLVERLVRLVPIKRRSTIKGQVWVKAEKIDDDQNIIGEAFSIVITDPGDCEKVLFAAGPYIVPRGNMMTHEKLIGRFALEQIHAD